MLVLFLTLLILALPGTAHTSTHSAESSQPTNSRAPRDTKPKAQPIKVVISDSCAQADSAGGDRELELDPDAPLVLTHRIRLVPTGGAGGGCSGCEAVFAALRERIERLEREVSALREKCGGAEGGCCASEQSKGPGCTVRPAMCPDDCNDQGRCVDGRCVCFAGFTGEDCSKSACPDNCSDRGKCVNGQCVCDPGFTGPDCSTKACPDNCNNRGQCVNGKCVCVSGFTGPDCSEAACPDNCNNRGRCVNGKCVCESSFTGPTCSKATCPDNCNNRGRCVNGKCVCDSGFTGPDCSEVTCPDNCNNRGQCVDGQCVCDAGFTGPDCSTKTCPDNCNNRGRCVNGKCVCESDFTGPTCSKATCPDNCNNRGRCVNGKCVCDSGFTGPDCSEVTCPDDCENRGQCVDGQCVCNPGFTGPDCSTKTCPDDCKNRGQCVNGKCVCDVGFTGPDCGTKACLNNCSNKGRCVRGKCVCRRGFTGPDCSECEAGMTGADCSLALTGVTSLTAKDITESSVTLTWTPPAVQYDTYHITFTSQKEGDQKITSSVGGRLTSYTQTGLAAGQEYHVSITGEKDGQTGAESTTEFVTMISSITNLKLVKTSTTYAIIQWEVPQMEIDRYHLSITPSDGGPGRQDLTLPPDVASAQIDHLKAGVQYDVSLVAEKDGRRSAPATIQVVPAESGETLSMVTAETKVRPVVPNSDRQRLRPISHPQDGKIGTRTRAPDQPKPHPKPGIIRRPGMPRPANATRAETGQRRVPSYGQQKKPGTYLGKTRWTSHPPHQPPSDTKPVALTATEDKEHEDSLGRPDGRTPRTDETKDLSTAPEATEVAGNRTELDNESSRNTTTHPSKKKCHPKLIVGHPHLNGTIKANVPVIRGMTYATNEEKVTALFKELQQHSARPTNTSSEEHGINLHISVFEVSPGHHPNTDIIKNPLANKTSADGNHDNISNTALSRELPVPLSSPNPSQPPAQRSEAAAELPHESIEFVNSEKHASSEPADSSESSEDGSVSSATSKESPRPKTALPSANSKTGMSDESQPAGSQWINPSSFPKGKFTRRPGLGPFQNRTRPFLAPPRVPYRGPPRRTFPHRAPNGGAINRSHPVQTGGVVDTDTRPHPKQRPGVMFRKRNDTRLVRPRPVQPVSAHTATSTAPPQPSYTTTLRPENSHPVDKDKPTTDSTLVTEEDPVTFTEWPNADRVAYGPGTPHPRRPGLMNGSGAGKFKPRPGGPLRKRPPVVSQVVTKTTPPSISHRTAAQHVKTSSTIDSVYPTEEVSMSITAKTQSEHLILIHSSTKPDEPKTSTPAVPNTANVTKTKPKLMFRTKNGTIVQLPPGHKPVRRPLKKTDGIRSSDALILAQPTPRSHGNTQSSTTGDQDGDALSYVGVQNVSSSAVTLVWGAPQGLFNNFVVTQKRPPKERETENQVADGGKGMKEREVEGEEDGLEDNKKDIATNVAEKPATTGSTGSRPQASPNDTFTKVLPGSARSFLFTGLRPQTQYVLSVFGKGPGGRSKNHSVTINTGPEPPTNLLFTGITDTTVSVSWTKPSGPVTGFKVTYTHTREGEPVSVSVGASDTAVDLSQLTPGSSYEVNIISLLNLDESDPLKDTVHTLPDPPTGLQAINITDTRALLLWRPALAAIDNYIIAYGSEKGPEVTISVSGNAAAQQLEQLEPSTGYRVTITSHLGDRKSAGATTAFITTGGRGGDGPKDLTASQVTPRSAVLTWKPPSSKVSGYKLQYAIEGQAFQDVFVGADLREHKLLRLTPSSKYLVRLQSDMGGVYTEAITTEFTTGDLRFPFPSDCSQELLNGVQESGLVEIFPLGQASVPVSVYCDMETDGGGWTVFQRRVNGKVNFFRPWKEYVNGFGDRSEEFWLGNELIHNLTKMNPMSLRVDMRAEGETVFAKYSSFSVGPAKLYTLQVSGYTGTAGDSMTYHNGRHFSTRDRDRSDIRFCAMSYRGGWWYRNCHEANLNGLYNTAHNQEGIIWKTWKGKKYSIPFVEMKMRPVSFRPPSLG
ncbi:hypothetical protein ACEWY4_027418 [Coilia grayii]|uniref:Tenascin n=1 Tax=Coilia grayii TaxID=363190 RepID=A0ABD1ISP7_9TELE